MKIKIIMKNRTIYTCEHNKLVCLQNKKWVRVFKYNWLDDGYFGNSRYRGRECLLKLLIKDVELVEEDNAYWKEDETDTRNNSNTNTRWWEKQAKKYKAIKSRSYIYLEYSAAANRQSRSDSNYLSYCTSLNATGASFLD